jgi:predicted DsbA family dithiol-disulfide isomerase
MDVLTIPVYYDFASTICYVAHRVMVRMAGDLAALAIALDWRPLDLVQVTGWSRGVEVEGPRRANALRVARDLAVDVRMPAYWLDSRAAHAVALALHGTDKEPAWRERVWSAVFEEGRDLGGSDALAPLAVDLGLDAAALAGSGTDDLLDRETAGAREAGVTGVPTFMLGTWPLGGIQEERTMRSLLERYARRARG